MEELGLDQVFAFLLGRIIRPHGDHRLLTIKFMELFVQNTISSSIRLVLWLTKKVSDPIICKGSCCVASHIEYKYDKNGNITSSKSICDAYNSDTGLPLYPYRASCSVAVDPSNPRGVTGTVVPPGYQPSCQCGGSPYWISAQTQLMGSCTLDTDNSPQTQGAF